MNALNHVIYQVFRVIPEYGFSQGIKELNVMDIYDLLHTSIKTWETIKFPYKIPGTETTIDDHCFSPTDIAKVITLKKWHKSNFSGGSTSEFFMSLSSEEFNEFRMQLLLDEEEEEEENTRIPTTPTIIHAPTTSVSPAEKFRQSIKRSVADYEKFKDETKWRTWLSHFKSTAINHGLKDVLDPDYVPITQE